MTMLVLGLLIWAVVHMVPVAAPSVRAGLVEKSGELPFKGGFSLVILGSVALMVLGWRSIESPAFLYEPPSGLSFIALIMLIAAMVLIVAAQIKCNFKRSIRHPQLTGFTLWALAHLMVNGDMRTTVLFGGLALWAVVTMLLLNKRDGAYVKPDWQLPHNTIIAIAIGLVLFIGLVLGHEYFTGVALSTQGAA